MRKKYLSALLFGALLFASAGTFTSCKDYDDDINNLQEQINTINTTLTELKGQIGTAGVSSVTFDETTGILTVVDGTGTKTYNIATSAEAMVKAEIKDGVLSINGEEIGAVVGEVTVKDGKLMVDGKEVASLGGESSVVLVKNEDTQTCTLTVDDQTVTLPLNADATTVPSVEFKTPSLNTWTVNWGVAASDITFGGTTYKTGSLLLGGLAEDQYSVSVKPITYDLSAQKLALVDIDGNTAPVKVVPSTAEETGVTSRAVSANGIWGLSLEMLDTVTEENIATVFTKKVNGVDQNLKYALTINGTRVTGYNIVIDTQTKNESDNNDAIDDKKFDGAIASVKVGENTLKVSDFASVTLADVVAATMTLNDINAEAAGVKVEGMKVTVPAGYAGKSITVKLTVLDVTGAQSEHAARLSVEAATVEEVSQVSQVTVPISTDGTFIVKFDDIFSKLDAAIVTSINSAQITTADRNFFALNFDTQFTEEEEYQVANTAAALNTNVEFYKTETADKATDKVTLNGSNDVRSIKAAKVTLRKSSGNYITGATNEANLFGTFNLTLSLMSGNNTVKKIVIPVKVVEPSFSDYFKVNTFMGWDSEGNVSKVLTSNITLNENYYLNAKGEALSGSGLEVKFDKFKNTSDQEITANATLTAANVIKDDKGFKSIGIDELSATAEATVATVTLAESKGEYEAKVKDEFKVKLSQQFAGAKLVYFNDGVIADKASVFSNGTNDYIQGYYESEAADSDAGTPAKYTGLAIEFDGKYIPVTTNSRSINNYTITQTETDPSDAYTLGYGVSLAAGSQGGTPSVVANGIQFASPIAEVGQSGKLVVKFVDNVDLNLEASIEYVKTNTVTSGAENVAQ